MHALRDVSLEIAPHSFCAVTGPSGCGKSTLLNLLGGLDQPSSGEITVDGLALHNAGEAELTAYRRKHLGIVFQFFNLLPAMTAVENVELPLLLADEPTGNLDSENAGRVLELFQKIASERLATLIMVTHSPEAAAAAERQIPMMDGRLSS